MKFTIFLLIILTISSCRHEAAFITLEKAPSAWEQAANFSDVTITGLENWYQNFNDPSLNWLIALALQSSPDLKIAQARLQQARGLAQQERAERFPELALEADGGRQKSGFDGVGNLYQIGFDASFEIDLFGKNALNAEAAKQNFIASAADFLEAELSLVAEITRN